MSDNPHLIDENNIPENWAPIEVPAMIPGKASSGIPAPVPHDMPQFFSGSLPPVLQHDASFIATEVGSPRIPKSALMPFGNQSNPFTNAAATSTSKIIAQQVVAAIPPSTGGSGTDVDIITGTNKQSFGSFDAAFQQATNLSTTGFTFNVTTQTANELAIIMGESHIGFSGQTIDNPGGWSLIPGSLAYAKVLPTAGAQVIPATYGGGTVRPAVAGLALFKTNGLTPAFTHISGQSGGNTYTSPAFTPPAGSTLLVSVDTSAQGTNPDSYHVSDTAGNVWVKLFDAYGTYFVATPAWLSSQVVLFYCQNPANVSTVTTVTVLPVQPGAVGLMGTLSFDSVSNLNGLSSGSYTFQTSDNLKLVQFSGGANITATLPSPAFAAQWQAVVSNANSGTTSITPAFGVLLNGSTFPVILPPGGSTWVWCDGTNYFTSTTALPSGILKQANQWVDSFDPISGLFTQSQPFFANLGGNIAIGQMAAGSGANASSFFRGDNTWNQVDYNNILGNNKAAVYNSFSLVSAGLIGEVATVDLTAQATAIAATTIFATPNGSFGAPNGQGMYEISYVAKVTTVATTSSTLGGVNGFQILYTDKDDSIVVTTPAWWNGGNNGAAPASASLNTTQTVISGTIVVYAKLGTNIQYKMDYTSAGATPMQYNLHIKVKALL